ncbi:MAG TPA: hypothetical protein VLB84_14595, partial [Bacteroidia bacterium]|nr:hypothetical protein [Bacteroidia bacterium]
KQTKQDSAELSNTKQGLSRTKQARNTKQTKQNGKHTTNSDDCDLSEEERKNLSFEVRSWVLEAPGRFHVTDIDKEVGIFGRAEKNLRSYVIHNLVKEGIIERYGKASSIL